MNSDSEISLKDIFQFRHSQGDNTIIKSDKKVEEIGAVILDVS